MLWQIGFHLCLKGPFYPRREIYTYNMYLESLTKFEDNQDGIHDAIDEFMSCHAHVTSLSLQPQCELQPRRHQPLDMPWKQNLSPA